MFYAHAATDDIHADAAGFAGATVRRVQIRWTRRTVAATILWFLIWGDTKMAKGYWITFYRSVSNPAALAEYAKLAGPAIQAGGGRFLARGTAVKSYEGGLNQRAVVIEFESVEKAIATHEGPAYRAAAKLLEGAVDRDIRIVEGV
jgi:uncharacterized protein (DUF1330 family)